MTDVFPMAALLAADSSELHVVHAWRLPGMVDPVCSQLIENGRLLWENGSSGRGLTNLTNSSGRARTVS